MDSAQLELLELARRIYLSDAPSGASNEDEIASYATWKLLNNKAFPERPSCITNVSEIAEACSNRFIDVSKELAKSKNMRRFTAHSHKMGQLDESPDDIVVYLIFDELIDINFIVDDLSCRRV